MAKINGIIQQRTCEIVIDKIGIILAEEIANQYELSEEEALNADVWALRNTPISEDDLPCILVSFLEINADRTSVQEAKGDNRISIECFARNRVELNRLMGVVWSILSDPQYKHLDLPAGTISGLPKVTKIQFQERYEYDANSIAIGRLIFEFSAPETFQLIDRPLYNGGTTVVRLWESDKGYLWGIAPENEFISEEGTAFISEEGQLFISEN